MRVEKVKSRLHTEQAKIRDRQRFLIDRMHGDNHEFMRNMDRAVLIHEALAILEGRNPTSVNRALWEVRTHQGNH